MRYLGGKIRIAKELAAFIANRHADRWLFVEPFMGGGNMTAALAPYFAFGFASDVLPDLALLFQALQRGWQPPLIVSEAEYAALRHAPPSAERAFAGFGCSFGGKWFGGYARSNVARNYASNARNGLLKQAAALHNVEFRAASYASLPIVPGAVYYCDPPYASTTGYACGEFDHGEFWAVMRGWRASGAHVYVSEYAAPADWSCVWEKRKQLGLRATDGTQPVSVERLFV